MRLSCLAVSKNLCPTRGKRGATSVTRLARSGNPLMTWGGDVQVALARADNFQPFSRLARFFQLTTIVQVALRRPLSTCHLPLPGKHSMRVDQRDDRLVQFAPSRPGDRS